jgi:hypothetical protein
MRSVLVIALVILATICLWALRTEKHDLTTQPQGIEPIAANAEYSAFAALLNQDIERSEPSASLRLPVAAGAPLAMNQTDSLDRLSQVRCAICHLHTPLDDRNRDAWTTLFKIKRAMFGVAGAIALSPDSPDEADRYKMLRGEGRGLWDTPDGSYAMRVTEFAALYHHYFHGSPVEPRVARPRQGAEKLTMPFRNFITSPWEAGQGFLMAKLLSTAPPVMILGSIDARLLAVSMNGELLAEQALPGIPTDITLGPDGSYYVTLIADSLQNVDRPGTGSVVRLRYGGKTFSPPEAVLTRLNRPVAVHFADLEGTGALSMLLLEFGWIRGALKLYKPTKQPPGWAEETTLLDAHGVISVASSDLTGNGLPDLIVLIAQAEQTLNIFYNRGEGRFEREVVAQYPPSFGFNSMMIADLDHDGIPEIVTTNGDNLLTKALTASHGVRIFKQRAESGFEEIHHYPMHGAIHAAVGDFTGNGRIDIAAISFAPDPEDRRSFVVLEQMEPMQFAARLHEHLNRQAWMRVASSESSRSLLLVTVDIPQLLPFELDPMLGRVVLLQAAGAAP